MATRIIHDKDGDDGLAKRSEVCISTFSVTKDVSFLMSRLTIMNLRPDSIPHIARHRGIYKIV